MNTDNGLKVRRSLLDLQTDYENGNKKPLEDLMRAWKGIKELPPTDPNSFFMLGGYHGEPFRGAGWGNATYWGGYCNHGNVLFPTWHRVYLVKLEEALRSIPGCEDVTMPYWDETCDEGVQNGIPWALTVQNFTLDEHTIDERTIPNPLRSFIFNQNIHDFISGDNPNYSKPIGYETVRYPLSGLVGSPAEQAATAQHNAQYPDYDTNVALLNKNIIAWLTSTIIIDQPDSTGKIVPTTISTSVKTKFENCLAAPNYTVFSNTTSADQWNIDIPGGAPTVVPLEDAHNDIHLSVGGFDVPGYDASPIAGANGDMGENDTAGLDPIFFFHHCFIDRVFWLWQKQNGSADDLEIIPEYPGTNSVDNQGPTPGIPPNSWLTLDTPLYPFKTEKGATYTSHDCINIEKQLGYTYGPGTAGSLDQNVGLMAAANVPVEGHSAKKMHISGVNRAAIPGSFLISAFANINGKRHHLGTRSVLSRWNVSGCANCQTHLEVKNTISLHGFQEHTLTNASYEVEVRTHNGVVNQHQGMALSAIHSSPIRIRFEVR